MNELRILGSLELRAADGHPILSLHAQPKRLALLAYLALAEPGGGCRRDTLLALFWPERDEPRARAALRQSVYHLRQVLGATAIVNGPLDELSLAADAVGSDAAAFLRAIGDGQLDAAMALYRGDLLEGFHLRGTPGFDEWRDRERARLREQAAKAAWSLAGDTAAVGDAEAAARWGRRALELSHDDEVVLQRYLRLLEELGDRVRALLEYDAFVRRVRRDFDLEPTIETRRIIDAIRLHVTVESPVAPPRTGGHLRGEAVDVVAGPSAPVPVGTTLASPPGRPRGIHWITAAILGSTLLTALAAWWIAR
jgi:serine/threonine-protein kinase